jgi:hypothetical protein
MAKPDNTLKRKQREEKEDAEDGLKFVIDGAKLKCDLCIVPEGDLKVNYDTPSTQDKRTATVVEKDKKSVIFNGNCKKSPQSASPCASVMKLADWKDVGTVYFQDKFPLLLKSTIKCEYGGVPVKITDCAQRNVIEKIDTIGAPVPSPILDFDIKFTLDKTQKTVVPFGILDFKDKIENPYFSFKYSLSKAPIDSLSFQIIDENDDVIYQMTHLETVIIKASKKPKILFEVKKPTEGPLISKMWDYQEIYKKYALFEPADYTKEGEYFIHWDGFDNNDVYDSTRFNNKKLKAKITAVKNNKQKSIVVDFSTKYSQVEWTDVKIDKKTKRIDVTLRVNLKDGGAKGLDCNTYTIPEETSYETFTPTTGKDPFAGIKITQCDWDKIPQSVLNSLGEPIIKKQTKSFEQLRDIVIEGIAQYWGRNSSRGKNITINGIVYDIFVNAINLQDKSKTMDDIPLVYHTNGDWGRSGNPASPITNIIPDTGVVQQLSYNVGYIKRFDTDPSGLKGWRYSFEKDIDHIIGSLDYDAISEYKETAAHEIGHEILQAYHGAIFSWQHKGSSYLNQETKPTKADKSTLSKIAEHVPTPYIPVIKPLDNMPNSTGEYYPKAPNEIDLMKYYNSRDKNGKFVSGENLSRTFAAENDVLGLIWLTKIKVK